MNKKLKAALVVSLCLNLLLAGLLVGGDIRCLAAKHGGPRLGNETVAQQLKEFRKSHKNLFHEMRKERDRAMDMLAEESVGEEEYMRQVDRVNELQGRMFREFSRELMQALDGLDREERQKVLEHFRKKMQPPPQ